jgi:excisionase family DNA binding protein
MKDIEKIDVTCPHCRHTFAVKVEPDPVAPNKGTPPRYFKLSQVAKMLDVGHSTLKRWIYEKKIEAVKFGAQEGSNPWRISQAEIERFCTASGRPMPEPS